MLGLRRRICGTYDEWRIMRRKEAEGVASETSGGLIKRSISFPPDMLRWLRERGKQIDRSVDWQVREAVEAMQAADATPAARRAERGR